MSAQRWCWTVLWACSAMACGENSGSDGAGGVGGTEATPTGGTSASAGAPGAAGAASGGMSGGGGAGVNVSGYAHVVDVSVTGSPGAYSFNVTLETTDVDCTHFADWWEVLSSPEGALLHRRILLHPHTEGLSGNPFTRDGGPIDISPDESVVVRAHLSDLGYVGVAQRGTVADGFEAATDVAPGFGDDVEALPPQPTACIPEEQMVGG